MGALQSYQSWVIQSERTAEPLWWSGVEGWKNDRSKARLFTDEEKKTINLPLAGTWRIVDECRHEHVEYTELQIIEYPVTLWDVETHKLKVDRDVGEYVDVDSMRLACLDCGLRLDFEDVS